MLKLIMKLFLSRYIKKEWYRIDDMADKNIYVYTCIYTYIVHIHVHEKFFILSMCIIIFCKNIFFQIMMYIIISKIKKYKTDKNYKLLKKY